MNVRDAAYHTVHDYPGGASALAPRMGMSTHVLSNKVNPNNETHHLRLDEANTLMALTGDYRILHAQSEMHSKVCIPVPDCLQKSEMDIFEMLLEVGAKKGDVYGLIKKSRINGKCPKNMKNILAAIYDMQRTLTLMAQQVKEAAKEKA